MTVHVYPPSFPSYTLYDITKVLCVEGTYYVYRDRSVWAFPARCRVLIVED